MSQQDRSGSQHSGNQGTRQSRDKQRSSGKKQDQQRGSRSSSENR